MLVTVLFALSTIAPDSPPVKSSPPNILVILADDLVPKDADPVELTTCGAPSNRDEK